MTVTESQTQRPQTQGVAAPSVNENLEQLKAAVKAKPRSRRLAVQLTNAFITMASPNKGVEFWYNAAKEVHHGGRKSASSTIALSQLLHCFRVQGEIDEGKLLKSMVVDNGLLEALQPLAEVFAARADVAGAFEVVEVLNSRCWSLDERFERNVVDAFFDIGDFDGVIEFCKLVPNRYVSRGALSEMMDTFIRKGDVEGGIQFWQAHLEKRPPCSTATGQLAKLWKWTGDIDRTIAICQAAFRSNPYESDIADQLTDILKMKGGIDSAIQYWESMVRLEPRGHTPWNN